ncbi:HlyD family efflux transporter periplasmic adaptor subunit [Aeoliella sp. SH292]|uniref:efflux RND transporter periplasmic adaptor subunit n=1 Tax=Aeoliella sp. SH292 TaxID=3454464 RepID=UPI003F9662B3
MRMFALPLVLLLALVLAALTNNASADVLRGIHDSATEYVSSLADDDEAEEDDEEAEEEEAEDDEEKKTEEPQTDDSKDDDSKDDDAKEEEKSERKTHTVKASPLKIELEVDSKFVARDTSEVKLEPEEWSEFKIVEIVPHGATVRQGETLVKFDGEKLKEAIAELELDQKIEELALLKAEQELPRAEESIKKAFEQAERALADAKVDYKNYQDVDREIMVRSIDMQLKSAQQSAENAREELDQLEKMYLADDLTEETEEIVLKRQRVAVEMADFMLERSKIQHARSHELTMPRNDISEKEALESIELQYERAKTALETDLTRGRYDLEKARRARAKSLEKHADLTKDLGLLEIKAPADGVVYYGSATRGEWTDMASMIQRLKIDASAPTDSVLMTIVAPKPLVVETSLEEKDLVGVKKDQAATVVPTADSEVKLGAKVAIVSAIPVEAGKFALTLELTGEDAPEWLVAGMTGKTKMTTYESKSALLVPKSAVHTADADDSKYVWIVDGDKVEKQAVSTGKTKGEDIEIVEGLEAGDVVSLDDEAKD